MVTAVHGMVDAVVDGEGEDDVSGVDGGDDDVVEGGVVVGEAGREDF